MFYIIGGGGSDHFLFPFEVGGDGGAVPGEERWGCVCE